MPTPQKPARTATPWITATCPITERTYKFRLELHRYGGCVNVRMHDESPEVPGKSYIVRNTRTGFFSFIDAARGLLRASRWERVAFTGKHSWRAVWNTTCVDYPLRATHAHTVVLHLDVIINPRRGRPITIAIADARELKGQGRGGVRTGVMQARANRRGEILNATSDMQNRLYPVLEKVANTQAMVGYTGEEKRQLLQLLSEVQFALGTLRDVVFNNKFHYANTPVAAPTPVMLGDDPAPITFDMDGI